MISALVAFVPNSLFSNSLIKEASLYLAGGLVSFSSDNISFTLILSPFLRAGKKSSSIYEKDNDLTNPYMKLFSF